MFNSDMLLNVLTPEEIKSLGLEKVLEIKKDGADNNYRLESVYAIKTYSDHCYIKKYQDYVIKRTKEVAQTHKFKHLTHRERKLLESQLRFIDDEKIISMLKEHNISKDSIIELNRIIAKYQERKMVYDAKLVNLEIQCEMKYEQAVNIISKLYPLLTNDKYQFNKDDKKTYTNALSLVGRIRNASFQVKDVANEINNNETLTAIARLGKNHFDLDTNHLYMFINKINELLVTNPDLFEQLSNKQKNIKKV